MSDFLRSLDYDPTKDLRPCLTGLMNLGATWSHESWCNLLA